MIVDGQRVRALESNAAWASKSADNTLIGQQTLARPSSGPTIVDTQQKINDIEASIGGFQTQIDAVVSDVAALQALDTFIYLGAWDASTNTPTLADLDGGSGVGAGATYRVSVAGTVDFGSGPISFNVNDRLVYRFDGIWEKWDTTDDEPLTKVEYRTITPAEESAKQITLVETPFVPGEVMLDVKGGVAQFYGDDFTVSGNILSWSGLGLDGLLAQNDKVRILYTY